MAELSGKAKQILDVLQNGQVKTCGQIAQALEIEDKPLALNALEDTLDQMVQAGHIETYASHRIIKTYASYCIKTH